MHGMQLICDNISFILTVVFGFVETFLLCLHPF